MDVPQITATICGFLLKAALQQTPSTPVGANTLPAPNVAVPLPALADTTSGKAILPHWR